MDDSKSIPSHDQNQQLEALRPGLTGAVVDPAAAKDTGNENVLKMFHEQTDYQPKHAPPDRKGA